MKRSSILIFATVGLIAYSQAAFSHKDNNTNNVAVAEVIDQNKLGFIKLCENENASETLKQTIEALQEEPTDSCDTTWSKLNSKTYLDIIRK